MPTPVIAANKMQVGDKGTGAHWTIAQVAARQAGQDAAHRKGRVTLRPPAWLKEDEETLKVWKSIIRKLRGIDLLDDIDSELLAMYCRTLVHCREMERRMVMPLHSEDGEKPAPIDEPMKLLQGWNRIAISLAEKLGLTPGGRARLAKHKAEKILDPFAESFGG